MYGRDFLSLSEFSSEELKRILTVALELKEKQKNDLPHPLLQGKTLAMIFQKPSTRTRVSFEVGMKQLGGYALNIHPDEIQMGKREPIADIAQVLSRYVDGVMMRVMRHTDITEFARYSSVPVINGLSDVCHPCQAVADMLTIYEHKGRLERVKLCYIGDGNNVCHSLIELSRLVGMEMTVCCPQGQEPDIDDTEAYYQLEHSPEEAITEADVVYTDVWTSMGQEGEKLERLRIFEGYTITEELMEAAATDAVFMHCLPAHRGEEVATRVVDGPQSVIFDQAENRLHAQKAILALLMSKELS